MIREKLINDMNFRRACLKYGLDWKNFEICGDVIVLNTKNSNLYVLFDKNYNTIGVENKPESIELEEFIKSKYSVSKTNMFDYPFEDYSLMDIVELSNKIEIVQSNHGHTNNLRINGKLYNDSYNNSVQILYYIKFLGEEIEQYFLHSYHMQMIGFEVPDVYSYIRNIIDKINECINIYTQELRRPYPSAVLDYLGQAYEKERYFDVLYDVISLLLREKGLQVKRGQPSQLEKITEQAEKETLLCKKF